MSEAFVLDRDSALREAREKLERLFTQGTLGRRIRAAHAELRKWHWTPNRVDEIMRGRARQIEAHELDQIRALDRAREIAEAKEIHNEVSELRARLARLEAVLSVSDEAFHQPHLEALRGQVRGLGGVVDRAGAGGGRR